MLVAELPDSLGARVSDSGNGWPSEFTVELTTGRVTIRAFCGVIGPAGAGAVQARPETERRFQNPSSNCPITLAPGAITLLLGYWQEGDRRCFLLVDPYRRLGRRTRFSIQVGLNTLEDASQSGWSVQLKANGEAAIGLAPRMFEFYLTDVHQLVHNENIVDAGSAEKLREAGLLQTVIETGSSALPTEVVERLRKQVSKLIRNPRFRQLVYSAYGRTCAACGIQLDLVEAAHLFPAAEPGSADTVDNGICLCANHHRAFDSGLLVIDPASWALRLDESRIEALRHAGRDAGLDEFLSALSPGLLLPEDEDDLPDPIWLERRYGQDDG